MSTNSEFDVVIRVQGLGKSYTIGHQAAESVPTLRDALVRGANGFLRGAGEMLRGKPIVAGDETEEFWALKDVSFEVRRGEVLGIIGRNGAGKSTLLKVLSRITEPSQGKVEISGRVASLLEVGTGFHPELSGRENIFLNGAILGMTRREIKTKFDEIVAFSEVERFLDTPVKRYSSGMYVRLAFAVAAHLEPEILVVDEVLAVGDAEFQNKCLGKMQDVASGGRTVLFVSHNLDAVAAMCTQSIELDSGTVIAKGATPDIVEGYLTRTVRLQDKSSVSRTLDSALRVKGIELDQGLQKSGSGFSFHINFSATGTGTIFECAVLFISTMGVRVAIADLRQAGILPYRHEPGAFAIKVDINSVPLVEGSYAIGLWMVTEKNGKNMYDLCELTLMANQDQPKTVYAPSSRGLVEISFDAKLGGV